MCEINRTRSASLASRVSQRGRKAQRPSPDRETVWMRLPKKEREKSNSCFSLRFFAPTDNESIKVQGGGGDMNPSPSASARHGSAHQQTAKLGSVGWGRPCENSFLYGSVRSRLLHRVSGLLRVLPCRRCPKWRIMLKLWAETCLSDGTGRCRREHIDGTLRAALSISASTGNRNTSGA